MAASSMRSQFCSLLRTARPSARLSASSAAEQSSSSSALRLLARASSSSSSGGSGLFGRDSPLFNTPTTERPAGSGAAANGAAPRAGVQLAPKRGEDLFSLAARTLPQETGTARVATFHKGSTGHFRHSKRKLNHLANLIAGRTADEAILQLEMSHKRHARRILSMLALARNHAVAKGLDRTQLVVAQSWTSKGASLPRIDIKGRGRFGVKHRPSSKLHVLLAEGRTQHEKDREHEREKFRRMIRHANENHGGAGERRDGRKIINAGVRGYTW